jgi:hypothetical protein
MIRLDMEFASSPSILNARPIKHTVLTVLKVSLVRFSTYLMLGGWIACCILNLLQFVIFLDIFLKLESLRFNFKRFARDGISITLPLLKCLL